MGGLQVFFVTATAGGGRGFCHRSYQGELWPLLVEAAGLASATVKVI